MDPGVYKRTKYCAVVTHRGGRELSEPVPVSKVCEVDVATKVDSPNAYDILVGYLVYSHPQLYQHVSTNNDRFYPQTEYTD